MSQTATPDSAPSRRGFLHSIGKLAGAGALYETMVAMGMLQTPTAWAGPATLPTGHGKGKTVAILGAGIAGMAAAYELQKAGYRCIILEALDRPGGRNFTARRGTRVVEDAGPHGRTVQTCAFDEGLYMNLGPARLPFHHPRLMHYCKEFAIPLEVYVMSTTANLFQTDKAFGGQAMPRYRLGNDTDSHIAELLSKAVNQSALDTGLSPSAIVERNQLRARLESALAKLSVDQREAFVMHYVEEIPYETMSELLDASVSALKMRVMRAREALGAALRSGEVTEPPAARLSIRRTAAAKENR